LPRGSCLCGAVSFLVDGQLTPPDACHCSQCRKTSGHYWASTDVPRAALAISGEDQLAWYRSSEKVKRGFCRNCGSPLFWDAAGRQNISISMGAFEEPTKTHLEKHIFVPDKGDYYDIADGLPRFGSSPEEAL
jgi:hypothetical protein